MANDRRPTHEKAQSAIAIRVLEAWVQHCWMPVSMPLQRVQSMCGLSPVFRHADTPSEEAAHFREEGAYVSHSFL